MGFVVLQLFGADGGAGVGQEEGAAVGQAGGGHLDDAAAVHLADDALFQQFLGAVAVFDEGGVLFEQVGEAVGAEGDAALVGDAAVAQVLHGLEEDLVGVFLGDGFGGEAAALGGLGGQLAEHVGVELGDPDLFELAREGAAGVGDAPCGARAAGNGRADGSAG